MIDENVVLAKASKVEQHLRRVTEKRNVNLEDFLKDLDRQESIAFNLQMAIQNCIDLSAHIIGDEGLGVASSTSEMLYILEENGYIGRDLTERMIAAVGFRNLIVHEYGKVDLTQIYHIAHRDIENLRDFVKAILTNCRLG